LYDHYQNLRPLIDAAQRYAADSTNGIENFIVSGHSLGGAIVDTFTGVDGWRFAAIEGLDTTFVSIASPGVDPDIFTDDENGSGFLDQVYDTSVIDVDFPPEDEDGRITVSAPANYISIAQDLDRVTFSNQVDDPVFVPGSAFIPNLVLNENVRFADIDQSTSSNADDILTLNLPNIDNSDVNFGGFNPHGFGAHHNSGIYYHNLNALTQSAIFDVYDNQNLIFGVGTYEFTPNFRTTGISTPNDIHDNGQNSLIGFNEGADFILGLEGDDRILGLNGDDALDGGDGADTLIGGADNDVLSGGRDADNLLGVPLPT